MVDYGYLDLSVSRCLDGSKYVLPLTIVFQLQGFALDFHMVVFQVFLSKIATQQMLGNLEMQITLKVH